MDKSAVFTPQPPDNRYRIEGCFFSNAIGTIQLEIQSGADGRWAKTIPLRVAHSGDASSNREIDADLDPNLSGIPDAQVTLVIYLQNRARLEFPGCFFVAVRGQPQLLRSIPSAWVKLQPSTQFSDSRSSSQAIEQLEYISPPLKGDEVSGFAAGASALVVRSHGASFRLGSDAYSFSNLNPGWVVDSVQLQTYSILCPGAQVNAWSIGTWDIAFNRHGFTVALQADSCTSYVAPFFNFDLSLSQYAVSVWLVGPIGTEPQ